MNLDLIMNTILMNSSALTTGKHKDSRIIVVSAGDYDYWFDVSFEDGQAVVHEFRATEYVDDAGTEIFDFKTGEEYDEFRREEFHADWVISHRE